MIGLCNFKDKFIIYFILFNICEICVRAQSDKMYFPTEPTDAVDVTGISNDLLDMIFNRNNYDANTPVQTEAADVSGISNDLLSMVFKNFERYAPFDAHDNFSWKLLRDVFDKEKSNVVISPFSVKVILAMLAEAAGKNTQTQRELIGALDATELQDNLHDYYKNILTSLKKQTASTTLKLETKLFTKEHIEPEQRYETLLSDFYDTDIESLDFGNAQVAAKHINDWCATVTNGKLQNLVTEENIKNNVILLANAIYFNGLWLHEFYDVRDGIFSTTPETLRPVQYIEQTGHFYYYNHISMGAKILRLPYKGEKFSMFILLPTTTGGLEELTKVLGNDQIKSAQFSMKNTALKVVLPKFKFEYKKDLKNTLSSLGVNAIFSGGASLPGLSGNAQQAESLKVSDVFQKAGIIVGEKGTEAYAVTVAGIDNKFGDDTYVEEFRVNRPFIFFIEEEATGSIVFAGKVTEPAL